jgi:DNA-binding HxlR family transcriptional regulator
LNKLLTYGNLDEDYYEKRKMSTMRNRSQHAAMPIGTFCPRFHKAVELVGGRWTGAVIRILLGGSKRFNELAAAIPGISDRLLASRLRELEAAGVVRREVACGPPVRVTYELTPSGAELDATVRALASWAERWIPAAPQKRRP